MNSAVWDMSVLKRRGSTNGGGLGPLRTLAAVSSAAVQFSHCRHSCTVQHFADSFVGERTKGSWTGSLYPHFMSFKAPGKGLKPRRHWTDTVKHKIGGDEAARQLKILGGVVAAVRRFVRARRRVNDAALNTLLYDPLIIRIKDMC
jgi:hypothetical protein